MLDNVLKMAWSWFTRNIKLPFDKEKLKEQSLDIAYNQGLTALISSLEQIVPEDKKQNLNHPMWQAVKQASQGDDVESFVAQAGDIVKNNEQLKNLTKMM